MSASDARFVSPLDVLLFLRSLAGIQQIPPSELAQLAASATERRYKAGEWILTDEDPVNAVYILVEGRVAAHGEGYVETVEPPSGLNWLRLHGGFETSRAAQALDDCLALELDGAELVDMLERIPSMLERTLRGYARQVLLLRSALPVHPDRARPPDPGEIPDHSLGLIERLKQLAGPGSYWEGANMDAVVRVARETTELRFEEGDVIWQVGDRHSFTWTIVAGTVRCSNSEGESVEVGAGFTLGFYDALAEVERSFSAVATSDGVALRQDVNETLAVLEHHSDMAMDMLNGVSRDFTSAYDEDRVRNQGTGDSTAMFQEDTAG